jgi:1,4-dihydroxy-2-naphthoyl-CoA synthase
LIVYGKRDAGIPESTVLATAECIADCRVWGYDGGHFEIYAGPIHEQCLAQEVDFLCRHLAAQAAQDDRAEHHHG